MIRTLIVDDEPLAREGLRTRLEGEEGIEIVGEADGGKEAVEAILAHQPDLVFLDIQMPTMDGFDVLATIAKEMPIPVVVFVTAHDDYALRAFDAHALDYVTKPVTTERFQQALRRARLEIERSDDLQRHRRLIELLRSHENPDDPATTVAGDVTLRRLTVEHGDKYRLLDVADIDWIQAAGNYVEIYAGERKHLLRMTLTKLEHDLDPDGFVRIHRSTIVNFERIVEIEPHWRGGYRVVLANGTRLRLSRTYQDRLLKHR